MESFPQYTHTLTMTNECNRTRSANVECHTKKGCTPFHLACKEGHLEIAIQLLEKGADTEVTNALAVPPPLMHRPCVLFCCCCVLWIYAWITCTTCSATSALTLRSILVTGNLTNLLCVNKQIVDFVLVNFQASDSRNNTPLVASMKNGHAEV